MKPHPTPSSSLFSPTLLLPTLLLAACTPDAPAAKDSPASDTAVDSPPTDDSSPTTDSPDSGGIDSDTADTTDSSDTPSETTPVRLNQLVTRLLHAETLSTDAQTWTITREHPGWLFVTATPVLSERQTARVGIDVSDSWLAQLQLISNGTPTEAMLEVPAGEHTVTLWLDEGASVEVLEVRAIPELRYDRYYPDDGLNADLGDEWTFLEENALPHLTTMVADWHWNGEATMGPWTAAGRSWSTNSGNPYGTEAELEPLYDYYVGVAAASGIGLDLDEFGGEDEAQWAAWTSALSQASARYPETPLSLYIGTHATFDTPGPLTFATTMVGLGHELLLEWYIGEQASEADLDAELDTLSTSFSASCAAIPGLRDEAVLVVGTSSRAYVTYDYRPDVDFHVHLDRQFEHLATDPAFEDLHGLGFWTASYMDEETIRWVMALYRHYGIEGATTPLSADPYLLPHVQNPDFEAEDGWTLTTSGQIGVDGQEWISEYEARWGSPDGLGDSYLHTTRGSGEASKATQVLTGLTPGRSYSLRYFTVWYEDLYNLLGDAYDYERDHPVHATVSDATVGIETVVGTNSASPASGVWVNLHHLLFVPDGDTVTLTLSDWQTDSEAGGEVWETYLWNFVQVQPYFEE